MSHFRNVKSRISVFIVLGLYLKKTKQTKTEAQSKIQKFYRTKQQKQLNI